MDRGLSIPSRVYEDLQPLSSLIHEDNSDTLTLTLPGYRKEQIKVEIDSFGTLKITGERSTGDGNKWSRFRKDFRTPANCRTGEILAKFENGVLNIIMPETTTTPPPKPKPDSTESTKLPPPPPPMVAPPATHEARVSPNKTVVPPSRKPANEPNLSPMKAVAPPNQKLVAGPILPTPKTQPPQTSAGTANAEALLPRKNPSHDYKDRKATKTDHHQHHHHHNPEEKKKWTSSSGSSTDDDSEHEHHDHVEKGKKEDDVHGEGSAAAGKLKKKKDELIQKMRDYGRQSGGINTSGLVVNMAVASLVVVALGVYVTWSFKSILLE